MEEVIPNELEEPKQAHSLNNSIITHSSVVSKARMQISRQQVSPTLAPYFTLTQDNKVTQFDLNDKKYKSRPFDVKFQINKFFKYVSLVLLQATLGPLLIPFIFLRKNSGVILRNFKFIGADFGTLFFYLRFASSTIALLLIVCGEFQFLFSLNLIAFLTTQVSEAVVVGFKLAYYHPLKLKLFELVPAESMTYQFEVTISPSKWILQNQELMKEEIEQSIKRLNIEPSVFIFFFMVNPSERRKEKIRHQFHPSADSNKYAGNGALMAQEIIEYFNTQSPIYLYLGFAALLTLARIAVVFAFTSYSEMSPLNIFGFVIIQLLWIKFYATIMSLCAITLRDLQRKVFAMNQLSHLLSAQQVELFDETKLFPTLNFLCIHSLFSWVNLRKVLLDYGLPYSKRQYSIISYMLMVALFYVGVGVVLYINPFQLSDQEIDHFLVFFDFDILSIILMAILMVIQGARINEHFKIHKGMLRQNLFLYEQMAMLEFLDEEHQVRPTDFVFKALKELVDRVSSKLQRNYFIPYSQFVVNAIEQVYQDLSFEEEYKPFKVLGIAMTKTLAIQLLISFAGILGTILANLYLKLEF